MSKFKSPLFSGKIVLPVYLLLVLAVSITSCKKSANNNPDDGGSTTGGTAVIDSTAVTTGTAEGSTEKAVNVDDLIENSTFTNTVTILMGTTATITNPLTSGLTITQSNGDVVINATASNVEYVVSGTTTNGSVKIYSDKKFKLTLNNATITNNDGPAINIQSSKRAFIVVADGTTNSLTDGTTYATSTEDMKGTIFAEGQVIFSGNGTLNIKGNNKHGIASDDYVRIRSGNINITGALSDGIHSNDAFIADGGTINVTSSGDGIQAEEGYVVINGGTFNIKTVDKGLSASYEGTDAAITPYVTINNGSITITTTAGEGIESKSIVTINDGTIVNNSYDDGINAAKAIYINGGYVYCYAINNDAIDSNGTLTVTGGRIVAIGASGPEASFDCDARQFKVTGGTIIGVAGATSSPTAAVSTIRSVVMGSGSTGLMHIEAADGTEALTFQVPRSYNTLLFASAKLKANTTYNVYTGGSIASGTNFKGLYSSGTYTKGAKTSTSFTTTNAVTQTGGSISKN